MAEEVVKMSRKEVDRLSGDSVGCEQNNPATRSGCAVGSNSSSGQTPGKALPGVRRGRAGVAAPGQRPNNALGAAVREEVLGLVR